MSDNKNKPITVPWVAEAPGRGERLVMMTAYDYPQARLVDQAGIDIALVGDSLAMVVLGHEDTLSVTVDEMLHHVKAVRRGLERALLVADMPYGSFHLGTQETVANAIRFVKEGGAQAVKIEGHRPELVDALTAAEIPVMAHLGLTPQSVHRFGGFRVQGRGREARTGLLAAARELEAAGEVSEALEIPTIGIGAGSECDGQVLVLHDLLGLEERLSPRFVRRYAELGQVAREALENFADDVREGRFPTLDESYEDPSRPSHEGVSRLYG
jgi:3-methyl-2-oxobutanoate hydroxymethyltransferase